MNIVKGTPCMQGWLMGKAETRGFSALPKRQSLQPAQGPEWQGMLPFWKVRVTAVSPKLWTPRQFSQVNSEKQFSLQLSFA